MKILVWAALAAGLLTSAQAAMGGEKKPPPWEKPLRVGRYLYLEHCSVCHEINKTESRKIGPTLFRFYQNEKTPLSGGEPTEEFFKVKVLYGGDIMPAYFDRLTEQQIQLISDFVRSKK